MTSGLMGIRNNLPYNIRPTGQTPFRMVYGRIHPTYFLAARDHRLGDQESISHRLHQLLRLSEDRLNAEWTGPPATKESLARSTDKLVFVPGCLVLQYADYIKPEGRLSG